MHRRSTPNSARLLLVINIRTFRNTDLADICSVWNAHHQDLSGDLEMDPLRFELGCLSKLFHDPQSFLIAEDETGSVHGFVQFGQTANLDQTDLEPTSVAVGSLCVAPQSNEDAIAEANREGIIVLAASGNSQRSRTPNSLLIRNPDSRSYSNTLGEPSRAKLSISGAYRERPFARCLPARSNALLCSDELVTDSR